MIKEIEATERVKLLREYYLNNAPLFVNSKKYGYTMDGNALIYYVEGWKKTPTTRSSRIRRAMAERYMLNHIEPIISDNELIVGQPDLEVKDEQKLKDAIDFWAMELMSNAMPSHMGLDYEKLLKYGVVGLKKQIEEKLNALDRRKVDNLEKIEFYESCLIELDGVLELAANYAAKAEKLAESADEKRRVELFEIAAILRKVPAYPAKTFREALQSIHFYTFNLFGLFSLGRPDQYLYPYYKADIEDGVLNEESAQELIDCLCLLYIPNVISWAAAGFMLGGRDSKGVAVENELTIRFLNSIPHTHAADPNIALCVTSETSDELLEYSAKLISEGHTNPTIWSDQAVTDSMLKYGYSVEDAREYTNSTCTEVTPIACSGVSNGSPYVNTLQIFLNAFYKFTDGMSMDEMLNGFSVELSKHLDAAIYEQNTFLLEAARTGKLNPARTSCLVNDCIEKGKSIEQGGAKYNHLSANFLGLMNVAECLNVIQRIVIDEKRVPLSYLQSVVKSNYNTDPLLLDYIKNHVVHYGNNDDLSDEIAKKVADIVCECCKNYKCYRGGDLIPGAFAYKNHTLYGKYTDASPDGRKSGQPLHDGSNPIQGYDVSGPTASILSLAAYLPARFLGGITFNVALNDNTKNLQSTIVALIKAYVTLGNPQMQINIVDKNMLIKAQKEPENYKNLLVRVGGYSDFFVKLDKTMQDEIISRSIN